MDKYSPILPDRKTLTSIIIAALNEPTIVGELENILRDAFLATVGPAIDERDAEIARLKESIEKTLTTFEQSAEDAWTACENETHEIYDDPEAAEAEAQTWENAARILRIEAGLTTDEANEASDG